MKRTVKIIALLTLTLALLTAQTAFAEPADACDGDVQRSLQAGLMAHLSKPVEPEALFETLANLIQP